MKLSKCPDKQALGRRAADLGAEAIKASIVAKGSATIVLATGASQFEMLAALVERSDVDWSRVTAFHLDEYVGISAEHPASFRRYLIEKFCRPTGNRCRFIPIQADGPDPCAEAERLSALIREHDVDVCFAGIGENGHLAFNDPPADLATEAPYILVKLDEACRRQQHGEGWFPALELVPDTAISMSIRQMMKARLMVLSVPDERKALAVRRAVEGHVSTLCPASAIQDHPDCHVFLDPASASALSRPAH